MAADWDVYAEVYVNDDDGNIIFLDNPQGDDDSPDADFGYLHANAVAKSANSITLPTLEDIQRDYPLQAPTTSDYVVGQRQKSFAPSETASGLSTFIGEYQHEYSRSAPPLQYLDRRDGNLGAGSRGPVPHLAASDNDPTLLNTTTSESTMRHEAGSTAEKPYRCPHCHLWFRTPQQRQGHQRYHLPKEWRPLECDQCEYRCFVPSELKKHVQIHMPVEQRRFACNHPGCTWRFQYEKELNAHLLSHLLAPTYRCQYCGKSSTRGDNLRRHQRLSCLKAPHSKRNPLYSGIFAGAPAGASRRMQKAQATVLRPAWFGAPPAMANPSANPPASTASSFGPSPHGHPSQGPSVLSSCSGSDLGFMLHPYFERASRPEYVDSQFSDGASIVGGECMPLGEREDFSSGLFSSPTNYRHQPDLFTLEDETCEF